jgi:hypothetical protein
MGLCQVAEVKFIGSRGTFQPRDLVYYPKEGVQTEPTLCNSHVDCRKTNQK